MKTLALILMITTSVFTEAFFHAGLKGWVLYAALVILCTICYCRPRGKHEKRRNDR